MYGRVWTLYVDPDLRIVHANRNCREARYAVKYNTLISRSVGEHDAVALREAFSGATACPSCKREQARRPQAHPRPPGFREVLP